MILLLTNKTKIDGIKALKSGDTLRISTEGRRLRSHLAAIAEKVRVELDNPYDGFIKYFPAHVKEIAILNDIACKDAKGIHSDTEIFIHENTRTYVIEMLKVRTISLPVNKFHAFHFIASNLHIKTIQLFSNAVVIATVDLSSDSSIISRLKALFYAAERYLNTQKNRLIEINSLQTLQLQTMAAKVASLEELCVAERNRVVELEKNAASTTEMMKSLQDGLAEANLQIAGSQSRYDDAKIRAGEIEASLQNANDIIVKLKNELAASKETCLMLAVELEKNAASTAEMMKSLQDGLAEANLQIAGSQSRYDDAKIRADEMETSLQNANDLILRLKNELAASKETCLMLANEKQQVLLNAREELEKLRSTHNNKISLLTQEIVSLQKSRTELQVAYDAAIAANDQFDGLPDITETTMRPQSYSHPDLTLQILEETSIKALAQSETDEMERLKARLARLEQGLSQYANHASSANRGAVKLMSENRALQQQLTLHRAEKITLQREMHTLHDAKMLAEQQASSLQEQVTKLQAELRTERMNNKRQANLSHEIGFLQSEPSTLPSKKLRAASAQTLFTSPQQDEKIADVVRIHNAPR